MGNQQIILDFRSMVLNAELFDSDICRTFAQHLPVSVSLQQWGNEVYGSMGVDLGEHHPVPEIPSGGIAYTNKGSYVCVFFGQTPAWPVEYIGQIVENDWKKLLDHPSYDSVTIRLSDKT